jgi:hypothetical protein
MPSQKLQLKCRDQTDQWVGRYSILSASLGTSKEAHFTKLLPNKARALHALAAADLRRRPTQDRTRPQSVVTWFIKVARPVRRVRGYMQNTALWPSAPSVPSCSTRSSSSVPCCPQWKIRWIQRLSPNYRAAPKKSLVAPLSPSAARGIAPLVSRRWFMPLWLAAN